MRMIPKISNSMFTSQIVGNNRGPKPKSKVEIKWSVDFAYAIGLIVSDGNVARNGRTITFASKDIDQIENFLKALKISNSIGIVNKGLKNQTYRAQISDVYFWNFLETIGIHPNKSKTIGCVVIPKDFFFDFIRGVFDGDGSIYSYIDTRWKGSLMFYISFASGSNDFIQWMQTEIQNQIHIKGHITKPSGRNSVYQLRYAKQESLRLLEKMYEKEGTISLSRKRLKIKKILGTIATPCQAKV
jgi:intein/homing endonuclease